MLINTRNVRRQLEYVAGSIKSDIDDSRTLRVEPKPFYPIWCKLQSMVNFTIIIHTLVRHKGNLC